MKEKVAIILAAGISSRMKTKMPKVLHEVCGRAMLAYVLDACRDAGVKTAYVIVGYGREQVIERFSEDKDIVWVTQDSQKGTGDAVLCCKEYLADFDGDSLVICGDMPLIRAEIVETLIAAHEKTAAGATLATAELDNPAGYGRIVRNESGEFVAIVEHNDCTEKQLAIKEVNPSYYCFDNKALFEALEDIRPDNAKNEYYLTDVLPIFMKNGKKVTAVTAVAAEDAMGVNGRAELAQISRIMQDRIQKRLMNEGVTIADPLNTWIDNRAVIGSDTIIEPFTCIKGNVKIGTKCRIGPFAYLRDKDVIQDGQVLTNNVNRSV